MNHVKCLAWTALAIMVMGVIIITNHGREFTSRPALSFKYAAYVLTHLLFPKPKVEVMLFLFYR